MDKRGLKTSLVVSIIVTSILVIYLMLYIINLYNDTNDTNKKVVENSNSIDILSLERIVDAFNSNCTDMKNFYNHKTLVTDIDYNIKLTTILNINNNNYNKDYIEKEYNKIFNENININNRLGTCPKIEYYNNQIIKLACNCKTKSGVVTKFIKSIKTDKEVKLYYKIAFYSSRRYLGNESRILSKDSELKEIIDSRVINEDIKEINYKKYLNDNYNEFYTYIYTFKLNGDNYYFYGISKE